MEIRQEKKITRADVGAVAGVTHVRIWQIEQNESSNINPIVLKAIAKKLGVKPEELQ
jgi:transcriptional regulator with XRE-family HTH domain